MEPQKKNIGPETSTEDTRFSIEALAKAQGVEPVTDLDEVLRESPFNEDDPYDLPKFIEQERRERREVSARKSADE